MTGGRRHAPLYALPRWLLLPLVLIAAACSSPEPEPEIKVAKPSPALWQVANAQGQTEAYLFGTIHALPDGVEWQTPALTKALRQSGTLVVEISELDDSGALATIFSELANTPGQPALSARVAKPLRGKMAQALKQAGSKDQDFASVETWAAALTLAQAVSYGDPENGVDRILLQQDKDVLVLEGARRQLSIFDRLPERDQRDLLEAVIAEAGTDQRQQYEELVTMWLTGDMETLARESRQGMLADAELRDALLIKRNRDWTGKITAWMAQKDPLFVAVGAAHLAGHDGLPALLAAKGYTIRRIQ